jgi:L-iditol 2-dehydrogenase
MWLYQLVAPGFVERVEVPDDSSELQEGQVRLRLLVAGLCGSDMPRLNGARAFGGGGLGGAPVHEAVGEVIESASPLFKTSQHVVGTLGPDASLSEVVTCPASSLIPVPVGFDDVEAVAIQPISTVLRAVGQFPDVRDRTAVVVGAGPSGLSFCHILKHRGVAKLSVVDPVERSETAKAFGADEFIATTGRNWRQSLDGQGRPDIVVEAVGHQNETIVDAIWAAAIGGFVFAFGEITDSDYVVPCRQIYEKALTFASGRTNRGQWQRVLEEGAAYVAEHKADFASYISHVLPLSEAQEAYSLYARPQAGRLKVAVVTGG